MSNFQVLSQTQWQFMLGRDEKIQPGFVDSQNFAHGFGFASRKSIINAMGVRQPTRWDFAKAVT